MSRSIHVRYVTRTLLTGLACLTPQPANAIEAVQVTNPIGKIARVFNPKLVATEDRVEWLTSRVSSLAERRVHAMKVGLGHRGVRENAGAPDPTVTLDLGATYPIEKVYLIPCQREFAEDLGIFPKRFTVEVSTLADFSQRTVLYSSRTGAFTQSPLNNPFPLQAKDQVRYLRLTVHEGHRKGMVEMFGLSEIVVTSNDDPVSFGATVTAIGGMNTPEIWFPDALVDGRTPLGIWQNGKVPATQPGDTVSVSTSAETVSWSIELDQSTPLDRVVMFPYQLDNSSESSVFPESMKLYLKDADGREEQLAGEWANPLPGAGSMTPLVIPLHQKTAKSIRICGVRPFVVGEQKIFALSEIQAWSKGANLASNLPVTRSSSNGSKEITSLTDGFTSGNRIATVAGWLSQLHERATTERELQVLQPIHYSQASESELNATWGAAVLLGMTFLIPVFVVERRRLMSRDMLDQLRKRIASDLHDDIGSNLGSISLIARTARKDLVRLHGPEEVADDLGEVESIARESSLAMRDIVWLLERRQDSIGDLVVRMRETAGRLLREIDYTVECESSKTTAKLSLDAKRHLFLFYKEAIHNVLKHSKAKNVSIRMWDEDDKLALEIQDNGIGITCEPETKAPIIDKLQDRARVLEGTLQIASSKDRGTHIRLFVKRSHLTAHPTLA
jgi:signal transduction histidine kinase